MRIRTAVLALTAILGLGMAAGVMPRAFAAPLWDTVQVNLPYPVTVGAKTLAPGDYTIEQLHSEGSTILLFYNGDGMKFETSAIANKAFDPETPADTTVDLDHIGNNYYIDKIWVQGKDYGYQLPLPKSARSAEKEKSGQ